MQLPFFADALFWPSNDNLGPKHPANPCMQVAFAAGAQGKPKYYTALKVVTGPYI